MSFANRHYQAEFTFQPGEHHTFISLADLYELDGLDKKHIVRGLYINDKSEFEAPVVITDTHRVNLPSHMTRAVREILKDKRSVRDINDGKVAFVLDGYENQHGSFFKAKWVDIVPTPYTDAHNAAAAKRDVDI